MRTIRIKLRDMTKDELDAIANHPDWYRPRTDKLSNIRAIEFEIAIDRIAKYANQDLRDEMLLHILYSGSLRIGFETCFQRCAAISGSFPTKRLRVAFAVFPAADGGEWEDAYGWPVSYDWQGDLLQVELRSGHVDSQFCDDLFVTYRLWSMQEAEQACREL